MSRSNDPQDIINNIGNIRKEILQLCNAEGSETTDFHALGFDCLLKKLREIEKILTGLREMPITAHSTPHSGARYQPVLNEHEIYPDRCCPEPRSNPEKFTLTLPDDLTPHTKHVLNEIYSKIEQSFDEFYENAKLKLKQTLEDGFRRIDCFMSTYREKQKADVRIFIENVLDDSSAVPATDTFLGDLSQIPAHQPIQPTMVTPAPMINMEAVRKTLDCPGIDPRLRQRFFDQLNDLNDLLSNILEQVDRRCPFPCKGIQGRRTSIPETSVQQEPDETQFQPLTCTR